MQWIEISIVCERVATDEVTTLFGDYADNGIIEEDVDNQPNLVQYRNRFGYIIWYWFT